MLSRFDLLHGLYQPLGQRAHSEFALRLTIANIAKPRIPLISNDSTGDPRTFRVARSTPYRTTLSLEFSKRTANDVIVMTPYVVKWTMAGDGDSWLSLAPAAGFAMRLGSLLPSGG